MSGRLTLKRFAPFLIATLGVVLLFVGWALLKSGLSAADVTIAFTPLKSIPLMSVGDHRLTEIRVQIPETAQWARIRAVWGTPDLVVAAVDDVHHFAYCLADLGVQISVRQAQRAVPAEFSYLPYGYSGCGDSGSMRIKPQDNEEILVTITTSEQHSLPAGKLIVRADWPYAKDKLVGHDLDEELSWPIGKGALITGMVLVAIAGGLQWRRTTSAKTL